MGGSCRNQHLIPPGKVGSPREQRGFPVDPPADPAGAARPNQHQNLLFFPQNLFQIFPPGLWEPGPRIPSRAGFIYSHFPGFSHSAGISPLYLLIFLPKNPSGGEFWEQLPPKTPKSFPKTTLGAQKKPQNCLNSRGFWLQPFPFTGLPKTPKIPHFPQISSSAVATNPQKAAFSPQNASRASVDPGMGGLGEVFNQGKNEFGVLPLILWLFP